MTARAIMRGRALSTSSKVAGDVLFHDDFTGLAGSPPDPESWTAEIGRGYLNMDGSFNYGWGNNELQYHTDDCVTLDGAGNLAVAAKRQAPPDSADVDADHQFVAGRVTSIGKRVFVPPVRIEAKIKFPVVNGAHLAWWTLGGPIKWWPYRGEIDLCEVFGSNPAVRATVAVADASVPIDDFATSQDGAAFQVVDKLLPGGVAVDADYLTLRTDWLPDSITHYINGELWLTATKADYLATNRQWPYDRSQQYLIFNFALQTPPDVDFTEAAALIDYVTVTQL